MREGRTVSEMLLLPACSGWVGWGAGRRLSTLTVSDGAGSEGSEGWLIGSNGFTSFSSIFFSEGIRVGAADSIADGGRVGTHCGERRTDEVIATVLTFNN